MSRFYVVFVHTLNMHAALTPLSAIDHSRQDRLNKQSMVAKEQYPVGSVISTSGRSRPNEHNERINVMLYWAAVFFIIAIVAGLFGFGGIAAAAGGIAQILFYVFVALFVLALIFGLIGRRRPPL